MQFYDLLPCYYHYNSSRSVMKVLYLFGLCFTEHIPSQELFNYGWTMALWTKTSVYLSTISLTVWSCHPWRYFLTNTFSIILARVTSWVTQYLRQNDISADFKINCPSINRRRSCQVIICCDHQKYFWNTTSGFTAPTHANLVVPGLVKAWYILFSGYNKNVFVTVRNTFLQKLSPKAP